MDIQIDLRGLDEPDLLQRAELMLRQAARLDCRQFVSPRDVTTGNSKLNLAFVANLFNMYPTMRKVQTVNVDIAQIEDQRGKTFRNWINSLGVSPYVNHLFGRVPVNWKKVNNPPYPFLGANMKKLETVLRCGAGQECSSLLSGRHRRRNLNEGSRMHTLALVWQLMRRYSLLFLSDLGDGEKIGEEIILNWVNTTLAKKRKDTQIRASRTN
ncbi:hypothetical protein INR49_031450 [Caranx melampygus]|nr:hypothetical protein INR49_031450 [Caranx melampygus]